MGVQRAVQSNHHPAHIQHSPVANHVLLASSLTLKMIAEPAAGPHAQAWYMWCSWQLLWALGHHLASEPRHRCSDAACPHISRLQQTCPPPTPTNSLRLGSRSLQEAPAPVAAVHFRKVLRGARLARAAADLPAHSHRCKQVWPCVKGKRVGHHRECHQLLGSVCREAVPDGS